jgi:N-acetyltransferase
VSVPVLIISGSMGAGKSTVLGEIHDLLVEREIPHAAIDFDALSLSWPVIRNAPFNSWIGFENLRAV